MEQQIISDPKTSFVKKIEKLGKLNKKGKWSEEQYCHFSNISLQRLDRNLAGAETEEKVFNNLRAALEKLNTKDTVVINGWNINYPDRHKCEFDFLIVSEPCKAIFQIEVKRTSSEPALQSAGKQLQKGEKLFQSRIPFPKEDNWKYVKVMFFALNVERKNLNSSDFQFCLNYQSYILGPSTDFSVWWEQMTKNLSQLASSRALNRNIYTQTVQFLTQQMYIQHDCFTNQNLLDYTEEKIEKISTPEKLFFWSKTQYPLFKDSRNKRMIFISHFGTGKTNLLKAMSRQLLERGEKVAFIFWEKKSLLQMTYCYEFKVFKDQIQVFLLKCRGEQKF